MDSLSRVGTLSQDYGIMLKVTSSKINSGVKWFLININCLPSSFGITPLNLKIWINNATVALCRTTSVVGVFLAMLHG